MRHRLLTTVPVLTALVLTGCGGDDDADGAAAIGAPDDPADGAALEVDDTDTDTDTGDEGALGAAADIVEQAEDGGFGRGTATVDLNGTTYEYAAVDGAITVCTELFGTFQVLLPLIDSATGEMIDGPELNLLVLQEGADHGDETPDLYIDVGTVDAGQWFAGESFFADLAGIDPEPIDVRADGLSFAATVPLTLSYDTNTTADAQIEVSCS